MKNMDILISHAQDGTLRRLVLNKSILETVAILLEDYELDREDFGAIDSEHFYISLVGEVVYGKYSEEYEVLLKFDREKCIGVTCSSL